MKMIEKVIEVPEYTIERRDCVLSFEEMIGYVDGEIIKAAYNTNNSGGHNFLGYKELAFEEINDVKEFAMGKPWLVISTYQENGYVGVFTRTGDEALKVRPSNWVEGYKNAWLYVIAGEQEYLDQFVKYLSHWINYGGEDYIILDDEGDYVDGYSGIDLSDHEVFEWAKDYGFDMADIRRVK